MIVTSKHEQILMRKHEIQPLCIQIRSQNRAQEGRPELIKKDGGEMLVSIVLDRPLDDAKAQWKTQSSSRKSRNSLQPPHRADSAPPRRAHKQMTNRIGSFFGPSPLPFGGSTVVETYSSPHHDRGPVSGGNRSAASCLCTVLRRALYHYATRSSKTNRISSVR